MAVAGRWILGGAVLAVAAGAAAWLLSRPAEEPEVRRIERAYAALRDAILQDDDEAFFAMHSRRAREHAVKELPVIRSWYLSSTKEEKDAFHAMNHITAKEFLEGDPQRLVVRMAPWWSGWRRRREMFATARVKDVRIQQVTLPDGVVERRGVLNLDISASFAPEKGGTVPDNFLPTVVFVRDPEGWRRRDFAAE